MSHYSSTEVLSTERDSIGMRGPTSGLLAITTIGSTIKEINSRLSQMYETQPNKSMYDYHNCINHNNNGFSIQFN